MNDLTKERSGESRTMLVGEPWKLTKVVGKRPRELPGQVSRFEYEFPA